MDAIDLDGFGAAGAADGTAESQLGGQLQAAVMVETTRTEALVTLSGVGPKVADCVALFSLDQTGCIPVDTHVWQIACRDYDTTLREAKSLTPSVYARVGECFRSRFGTHAGWAHSLLFAAELPAFITLLPTKLQDEVAAFRKVEKEAKAQVKAAKSKAKSEAKAEGATTPTSSSKSSKGGGAGSRRRAASPASVSPKKETAAVRSRKAGQKRRHSTKVAAADAETRAEADAVKSVAVLIPSPSPSSPARASFQMPTIPRRKRKRSMVASTQ